MSLICGSCWPKNYKFENSSIFQCLELERIHQGTEYKTEIAMLGQRKKEQRDHAFSKLINET